VHFNASYAANLGATWVPVGEETLAPVKGKASSSDTARQSVPNYTVTAVIMHSTVQGPVSINSTVT